MAAALYDGSWAEWGPAGRTAARDRSRVIGKVQRVAGVIVGNPPNGIGGLLDGRLPRELRLSPLQLGALDIDPLLGCTLWTGFAPVVIGDAVFWMGGRPGRPASRSWRLQGSSPRGAGADACSGSAGAGAIVQTLLAPLRLLGGGISARRGEFCFSLGRGGGFPGLDPPQALARCRPLPASPLPVAWSLPALRRRAFRAPPAAWCLRTCLGRRSQPPRQLLSSSGFLHHRRFDPEQRQRRRCSRFILLGKYLLGRCLSRRSAGDFLMRRAQ